MYKMRETPVVEVSRDGVIVEAVKIDIISSHFPHDVVRVFVGYDPKSVRLLATVWINGHGGESHYVES